MGPHPEEPYFESQVGAWCGMHAMNNYLGGPYVSKEACRAAAAQVVHRLGAEEDVHEHLHPHTGFLSIDVINLLGASQLGMHVDGEPTRRGWSCDSARRRLPC